MILLNFYMALLPCKNRSSKRLTPRAAGEAWWPIMSLSGWSFQGLHEKTPVSQGVCGLCDGVWRIVQGQAHSTCSINAYLNKQGWPRHAFSPCVASEFLRCLCYQKYIRKTIVSFNPVRIFLFQSKCLVSDQPNWSTLAPFPVLDALLWPIQFPTRQTPSSLPSSLLSPASAPSCFRTPV